MKRREAGFSLVELLMVCVILAIISAIAIPQIVQIVTHYKLDAAGRSISGILQQARLQAVQSNRPAYGQVDTTKTPSMFYVNADQSAYAIGNPDVELNPSISFIATGSLPTHDQLDTYVGGQNGASIQAQDAVIGFNARGLPCVSASGNPLSCSQLDASSKPVAFEWFMKSSNGGWVAVTVTPAGRIRSWRLSNPSSGTWQ